MSEKEPKSNSGKFIIKGSQEYWDRIGQILILADKAVAEEQKINETVKARAKALRKKSK